MSLFNVMCVPSTYVLPRLESRMLADFLPIYNLSSATESSGSPLP